MAIGTSAPALRQIFVFQDLEPALLDRISPVLQPLTLLPGEIAYRQGDAPTALYFILSGQIQLLRLDANGRKLWGTTLHEGDCFGALEMLQRQPRRTQARAVDSVRLLRWEASQAAELLNRQPRLVARLRFIAETLSLNLRFHFPWLAPDETIYGLARKHPILLLRALTLPIILLAIAALIPLWIRAGSALPASIAVLLGLAGCGLAAWNWIDWGNDYYIVTDRRVVWLEKVVGLYDSRRESPLHMILSVTTGTDALGRSLDYGDVTIRTFTGHIGFKNLSYPVEMSEAIQEQMRRHKARQQQIEQASMRERLQAGLAQLHQPAAPPEVAVPPPAPADTPQLGLDHWTFQVRFEQQGVITYRKHWAVLIRAILAPSFCLLGLGALLALRLADIWLWLPRKETAALAAASIVLAAGWWLYRYIDWANDLYQISPTHIVDIYKRPLGRELRKVAPLENILGTEVDRKGILGLLLNYGNVHAEVGTETFDFEGVFDPVGAQQDIVRAQEALLERKRASERRQRDQEMVEWLKGYHSQVSAPPPKDADDEIGDDYP
jgi:hypothetical protein